MTLNREPCVGSTRNEPSVAQVLVVQRLLDFPVLGKVRFSKVVNRQLRVVSQHQHLATIRLVDVNKDAASKAILGAETVEVDLITG